MPCIMSLVSVFLESVYQNALYKELCSKELKCEPLKIIEVYYKGEVVGKYIAVKIRLIRLIREPGSSITVNN